MKKVLIQGSLTILLFITILFVVNQINWMSVLKIENVSQNIDEKLGELYWDLFKESGKEIENPTITGALDSILNKVCTSNFINKSKIKLHVLENEEINAFALPDGHIVIYSGLILASESETEFSGVLCHEIAHVELDHVMKKLVKEVGLSTLLSITTGNQGGELFNEAAKVLSSSAYDRSLEKQADAEAVKYLIKSEMDPEFFALLLFRLRSRSIDSKFKGLKWISTHPDIEERMKRIITEKEEQNGNYKTVLSDNTWIKVQETLKSKND